MKTLNEIKQLGDILEETKQKGPIDPPMVVVLKRRAIRIFPNGKRVALYHNDKLGLDITVPYSPHQLSGEQVPGVNVSEDVLLEKEHDDLFGSYVHALKLHYESKSKHTDHPELLKMKVHVMGKYGKMAFGHLHMAAQNYLNGFPSRAMHHYSKFERKISEEYIEYLDDVEHIEEATIHRIHHLVKTKQDGEIVFKNGARGKLSHPQAAHIMKLHLACTPENKKRIEALVNSNPAGLQRVADFAAENLK